MNDTQEDMQQQIAENPMDHPEEQPAGTETPFRFGRLFLFLAGAVALIGIIALAAEAYFSA